MIAPAPPEGGDARARRVPDARGARAARARGGVPADDIVIAENGIVVELSREGAEIVDHVEAGITFVDGLGVGDVQRRRAPRPAAPLRGRRADHRRDAPGVERTARRRRPELIARGFGEAEPLLEEMRDEAERDPAELLPTTSPRSSSSRSTCTTRSGMVYDRTPRRPMILPVLVEV